MIIVLESDSTTYRKIGDKYGSDCRHHTAPEDVLQLASTRPLRAILANASYGSVVVSALRAVAPFTPVLVMSDRPSTEEGQEMLKAGALVYLDKPRDLDCAMRVGLLTRLIVYARRALARGRALQ